MSKFISMQVEQLHDGMVFYLSALPINSYDALKEIYTLCEQGKLKGQTLSHAKKGTNAKQLDLKSNNFKCLRGIELSVVNRLLTELKDCNLSAGQLEPFRKLNFSGPTLPVIYAFLPKSSYHQKPPKQNIPTPIRITRL